MLRAFLFSLMLVFSSLSSAFAQDEMVPKPAETLSEYENVRATILFDVPLAGYRPGRIVQPGYDAEVKDGLPRSGPYLGLDTQLNAAFIFARAHVYLYGDRDPLSNVRRPSIVGLQTHVLLDPFLCAETAKSVQFRRLGQGPPCIRLGWMHHSAHNQDTDELSDQGIVADAIHLQLRLFRHGDPREGFWWRSEAYLRTRQTPFAWTRQSTVAVTNIERRRYMTGLHWRWFPHEDFSVMADSMLLASNHGIASVQSFLRPLMHFSIPLGGKKPPFFVGFDIRSGVNLRRVDAFGRAAHSLQFITGTDIFGKY